MEMLQTAAAGRVSVEIRCRAAVTLLRPLTATQPPSEPQRVGAVEFHMLIEFFAGVRKQEEPAVAKKLEAAVASEQARSKQAQAATPSQKSAETRLHTSSSDHATTSQVGHASRGRKRLRVDSSGVSDGSPPALHSPASECETARNQTSSAASPSTVCTPNG